MVKFSVILLLETENCVLNIVLITYDCLPSGLSGIINLAAEMKKDYKLTQMYMPFYAACISAALGFLFFFLSFSSPYWLQSYDRVHSSFLHMGIWSVCFDNFVHPQVLFLIISPIYQSLGLPR